jgi:uncharacterized protein (DUF433 family)
MGAATTQVRYTLDGVAEILRVPPSQVRHWIRPRDDRRSVLPGRKDELRFDFLELLELMVVKHLVEGSTGDPKLSLRQVRMVITRLESKYGPYPLARAKVFTLGKQLITEVPNVPEAENPLLQQYMLDFFKELALKVELDDEGLIRRLFLDQAKRISIDPSVRFGVPVVSGHQVPIDDVYARFEAEGTVEDAANWLEIEPEDVEAVIGYYGGLRSAA